MARVLVVDDEDVVCDLIREILESVGHAVVSANDGAEALSVLVKEGFDLALVDIMMPKIDGYHLATHILGLPNPPAVIFVSARNQEQDQKIMESLGASAFVHKPFKKKELLQVVATILAKRKPN